MGTATNGARCKKCNEEFCVVLEWEPKQGAIEKLQKTKCPKCESDDWYLTDEMGQ